MPSGRSLVSAGRKFFYTLQQDHCHPAIAKVLDAGSTPQGTPDFVMEYVSGVPITTYCDNHRLSTRDRLELFMHVCEGVQHAHQKAIIHRDLKPSNILVTEVDGHPAEWFPAAVADTRGTIWDYRSGGDGRRLHRAG